MRRRLVLPLLLLAAAPAAAQKPDAILETLRATPATLIELSVARLEALVNTVGQPLGFGGSVSVQDGRIQVYAYAEDEPASEARCRAIVTALKRSADVHPDTGEPFRPASVWASFFSYPRIEQFKVDPSWDETVDAMFRIQAVIGVTGDGKGVVCESMLLGRDVAVKRE
ncbi:MAG: hypothetical protein IT561_15810 [Alphaproteobacteria bacterium]|nr:hypothetical protein [Alphaproteobacteria bacterium]